MRCELISLGDGDPATLASDLRGLVPGPGELAQPVAEIIEKVRLEGDEALRAYTRLLDTGGADPSPLLVAATELTAATEALDARIREGLELAMANVRRVCEAQRPETSTTEFDSHSVAVREVPVDNAAVYVPGGRAPYPSTVVMGVVTARAAGVGEVVVCSPPGRGGELHPAVLAAAGMAGASAVYRMGGAQAVAALAHGTASVAPVDVIVGPGNLYVQEAKRQLSGRVGIDGFAGPTDLVVIAGARADLGLIELDLLAQAEHGDGTLVTAISSHSGLLQELQARLERAPETGALARLVQTPDTTRAVALAEALAPEHLELVGPDAEALAGEVKRAGCVFVGAQSAAAFGDYVAGSNHILPTGGSARFASALSPSVFRRRFYEVRVAAPDALARAAAPLARTEGFEGHARSMEARIRDNLLQQ